MSIFRFVSSYLRTRRNSSMPKGQINALNASGSVKFSTVVRLGSNSLMQYEVGIVVRLTKSGAVSTQLTQNSSFYIVKSMMK